MNPDGPDPARIRAFERGRTRGRDPVNSGQDGPAQTTGDSDWFADYCQVCGNNFRRGEAVYVTYRDGEPEARHQNTELPCVPLPADAPRDATDPARVARFYAAVDAANPPPPHLRLTRLDEDHPLLAPVMPLQNCKLCSNTFRVFERVVVCPCSPLEPKCGLGVHRDAGKGLMCYDDWAGQGILRRCPTSLRKLTEQ